jgi:GH24 family phage-related lysozyme (muramidase)
MKLSDAGIKLIKSEEGLASTSATKRSIGNDSLSGSTPIYAYRDTSDLWTIGWGSRFMPDGSAVREG